MQARLVGVIASAHGRFAPGDKSTPSDARDSSVCIGLAQAPHCLVTRGFLSQGIPSTGYPVADGHRAEPETAIGSTRFCGPLGRLRLDRRSARSRRAPRSLGPW